MIKNVRNGLLVFVIMLLIIVFSVIALATDFGNYKPLEGTLVVAIDNMPTVEASKKYKFGLTVPHLKDEFWIAFAYGCEDEAKKLGIDLAIVEAGGYGKIITQVNQIEDFVTKGYDAIILGATDYEGPAIAVSEAWKKNVPVVAGSNLINESHTPGAYTNYIAAAAGQADYIGRNNPTAKVAFLNGPAGAYWSTQIIEAFKDTLKKYPGVELVIDKYHDMDIITAMNVASDIVQKYPDIDYIGNASDFQAKGVIDALRSFGKKPGEIGVTCLTMGSEAFELFKEGWIQYAIAERSVLCGRLCVRMAVKILEGEIIEKVWTWEMPGFAYCPEDIEKFEQDEWKNNWAPKDWRP